MVGNRSTEAFAVPMKQSLRPTWIVLALALLVLPPALWRAQVTSEEVFHRELAERSRHALDLYVASLRGALSRYEVLPLLLINDPSVVGPLLAPEDQLRIDAANRAMERINEATGAADIYLMDRDGLTIAASNWNQPLPFVGGNFSYRPYFQQAMEGGLGRYFALGTTSRKRGYYYAYPVRHGAEILGAVVVKVDIDALEAAWSHGSDQVLVTDPEEVVFLSSNPDWTFNALRPLSAEDLERIRETRRYDNARLPLFPLLEERQLSGAGRLITVETRSGPEETEVTRKYLVQRQEMAEVGWTVHILADTRPAREQATVATALAGFALVVLFLAAAYLLQWRRNLRERIALQRRAQERLEQRVSERTAELTHSNQRLQREIGERRRTEAELRQMQEELVQAEKLAALGQMSAGISHELNQPLAAIRSYTDNARTLIERARHGEAVSNLEEISILTSRMAGIVKNLKIFARKQAPYAAATPVAPLFDDALALLAGRIDELEVTVARDLPSEPLLALGQPLGLQQVLVNLIGNALDAMAESPRRELRLAAGRDGDGVWLRVRDSGPGLPEGQAARLFDPFFTTKEIGEGLGLGLSISYGIVKSLGGSIRAADHPEGGAEFTIRLPAATAPERESAA